MSRWPMRMPLVAIGVTVVLAAIGMTAAVIDTNESPAWGGWYDIVGPPVGAKPKGSSGDTGTIDKTTPSLPSAGSRSLPAGSPSGKMKYLGPGQQQSLPGRTVGK